MPAAPVPFDPSHPLPPVGRTFIGGFESAYHPAAGVDPLDVTGHGQHGNADLEHLLGAGVRHLRAPLLSRLSRVRLLHPPAGDGGICPSCAVPAPCPTAREIEA